MKMIEISALPNGAHRNQTFDGILPQGWAVVPETVDTQQFPFGEVTVEEIGGVVTVTGWMPGQMPASLPEPAEVPTEQADTEAMLIDHEYRLTLLELGLSE